jgi:hypothetical protein
MANVMCDCDEDDIGEIRTQRFEDGHLYDVCELGNVLDEEGDFIGRYYCIPNGTNWKYHLIRGAKMIKYDMSDYDEDAMTGTGVRTLFMDGVYREVDKYGKVFVNGIRVGRSYQWCFDNVHVETVFIPWSYRD